MDSEKFTPQVFQSLLNSIGDAIVCIDSNMNILLCNLAFADILKTTCSSIIQTNIIKYFSNNEYFLKHILQLDDEYMPATEITMEHDSLIYSLSIFSGTQIPGDIYKIVIIRNITQTLQEAEQIREEEKSTSLAYLTAGMAHEMNNPLSGIGGFADLLIRKKERFGLNDQVIEIIEAIKENASRAATILSDLLSFSRTDKSYIQMIDIHELLGTTIKSQHLPEEIAIRKEFRAASRKLQCDPERVKRAVANILSNSVNGINKLRQEEKAHKGLITVRTFNRAKNVVIEIRDNGFGIPLEHMKYIFDPFFSDGKTDTASGMGLYTARNIINSFGGTIEINSNRRETCVQISLPALGNET
jgi:signal transduction histidine kinase